ncbi:MAG: ribosome recycling factor [Kordiimonadaceae bacterium]|jgi:ribosome recycling factor|nr:ribosome recycling factor [Kordiimonadaceae bacterium]MBT6035388.1 ribosome recycling factor [Kordiimonadaceae bacterium]MBT6330238.1 ribosome recycling factor [Kordiimonadaceae bacterium]MBT7582264.1 ribosome recycling factor [Kordiimonadaceae bacterium]
MSSNLDLADIKRRMNGALENLKSEFVGLRTGRASVNLLDPVVVDAYGAQMPINQVGTVSTPEARLISVHVWDKGLVASVEKAIRNSGIGLNPIVDGDTLRIPIPELNEERRTELTKLARNYSEHSKIAVRNVRRDGMETIKHMEKDGDISQDEQKNLGEDIQDLTDKAVKNIDELTASKEVEIMQV